MLRSEEETCGQAISNNRLKATVYVGVLLREDQAISVRAERPIKTLRAGRPARNRRVNLGVRAGNGVNLGVRAGNGVNLGVRAGNGVNLGVRAGNGVNLGVRAVLPQKRQAYNPRVETLTPESLYPFFWFLSTGRCTLVLAIENLHEQTALKDNQTG
ncbi:hypothetical protein RRG08_057792 [Elysia crispata]|uniref:Uncharacterized protein n=1 Tax=Elysia crispata TaxID=231223 RepID=A0AAE1D9L8_9GAST|nr:hypothetical protein RRG08_057792 [Elysia crispata]